MWRARLPSIIYRKILDMRKSFHHQISLSHLLKCLGGESLSFWLKFGKIHLSFYIPATFLSSKLKIIFSILKLSCLWLVSMYFILPVSRLDQILSLQLVSFEARNLALTHSIIWSIKITNDSEGQNPFVLAPESRQQNTIVFWGRQIAEYFPAEQTLIFRFRCFQYQECYSLHILLKKLHFLSFSLRGERIGQGKLDVHYQNEISQQTQSSSISGQPAPDLWPLFSLIIQQLGICNKLRLASRRGWQRTILCLKQSRKISPSWHSLRKSQESYYF